MLNVNVGEYDMVVLGPDYYPATGSLPNEFKMRNCAVHYDFVDVATTLQEHGLEGAAPAIKAGRARRARAAQPRRPHHMRR